MSWVFGVIELNSLQAAWDFYERCKNFSFKDSILEFTPAEKGALVLSDSYILKSSQTNSVEIELFNILHSECPSLKWVKAYCSSKGGLAILTFDSFPESKYALEQYRYLTKGSIPCLHNSKFHFADPYLNFRTTISVLHGDGIELKGLDSFNLLPLISYSSTHWKVFDQFSNHTSKWFYSDRVVVYAPTLS